MTKAERARELFLEGCNWRAGRLSGLRGREDGQRYRIEDRLRLWRRDGRHAQCLRRSQWDVHGLRPALRPADPSDRAAKAKSYETLRQLAGEFEARNGSLICRQLLGLDPDFKPQPPEPRTDGYYKKRPCPEMVYCAADILEEYLSKED